MKKYFNKITIVILLTVGAVVMGIFLLWPMFQELSRVERELEQYNMALTGREKYVSDLAILGQRLDTKREAIRKIEAAIPDNTSIPALFDLLQNISINSGLVLTSITDSVGEEIFPDSDLAVTSVSLQTTGSYSALKEFLSQLRRSVQLLEVVAISFDSTKDEEQLAQEQFDFIIELHTYED